jgi:hypothetical protein
MVDGRATGLEAGGDDAKGLAEPVRSHVVLARAEGPLAAINETRPAIASHQDRTAVVGRAAGNAGLQS